MQPSITVTMRDLGLLNRLVACTKYCLDVCPEVAQTKCAIVEDSWTAKTAEILAAKPDLVLASVPYQLDSLGQIMKAGIPFLGLAPKCLADVFSNIAAIARIMGVESQGQELIARMRREIEAVRQAVAGLSKPLVYCEEWGKPLILSERWAAELVEIAGGTFLGQPGTQIAADEVAGANPDVIVAAWCGAGDRVPLERIIPSRQWEHLNAVRQGRVYCINDEFLNTPASTLIHGLHALAAAIHPEEFVMENGLRRIESSAAIG